MVVAKEKKMAKRKPKAKPKRDSENISQEKVVQEKINLDDLELDEFLMKLTSAETIEDARKNTESILKTAVDNVRTLQGLGVVTIVVAPSGAITYTMSPYLEFSLAGLDVVEKAFRDIQEGVIRPRRAELINRQTKKNEQPEETIEDN
jgi:hypothetical protein